MLSSCILHRTEIPIVGQLDLAGLTAAAGMHFVFQKMQITKLEGDGGWGRWGGGGGWGPGEGGRGGGGECISQLATNVLPNVS